MEEKKKRLTWKTWRLEIAKSMPPLHHTLPGEPFDISKSEVIQWLMDQPDIMQMVFNAVKEKYIVYDRGTSTWRGIDYEA